MKTFGSKLAHTSIISFLLSYDKSGQSVQTKQHPAVL